MTVYYVDTSVLGRAVLRQPRSAVAWFESAVEAHDLISSRLLKTEMTRLVRREGMAITERDEVLDFIAMVPVDHAILTEAEAIVPHVRTLDAIHLATALRSGIEDLVIASHDRHMLDVAQQIGFTTFDPCAGAGTQL